MTSINYNPDVLLCLANLSNDEVFTPPELANSILDLLPKDIWKNKDAKFLDPVSKSGVFLREITKRLIVGLEDEIPDLQTRVNHILKNQVFVLLLQSLLLYFQSEHYIVQKVQIVINLFVMSLKTKMEI